MRTGTPAPIGPMKDKINVLGNFNVMLDGAPNLPHTSGGPAILSPGG